MLEQLGLAKIAQRPCRELSFGMRQRVGLAAALVGPVELVLLDETLNGLDPHAARSARATLRAAADRGAAILMSTHLLGVAERMCDRILLMDKGKLVADRRGDELAELLRSGHTAIEDFYVSPDRRRGSDVAAAATVLVPAAGSCRQARCVIFARPCARLTSDAETSNSPW